MKTHHVVIAVALSSTLSAVVFGQSAGRRLGSQTLIAQPAPGAVVIFERRNFTGRSATLAPGEHRLDDWTPASIRVPAGMLAYLYEFADASGGFGISVDLLEDHRDLSEFRMSRVSLVSVSAATRPGFAWARGRRVDGQFVPGHWERERAGGNPVNTVAVASPPLPGHSPRGATSIEHRGATWTITSLGQQTPADDGLWRGATSTMGVIGSDFRGPQEIGSAAFERASNNPVIPDWFDFWFPNKQPNDHRRIVYFKRTLAGVVADTITKTWTRVVSDRGGNKHLVSDTYDLSAAPYVATVSGTFADDDLNIDIQPFVDYQYLIEDSHAPERSTIKYLKDIVDSDHDPCTDPFFKVGAEVDAPDSTKQSIVELLTKRIGKPIAAYGPWVFDVAHCSHPEIHPSEEVWWADPGAGNEVAYHFAVFADASERFWWRSQMDGDSKLRPWGAPPVTGLYAIAFAVNVGTAAANAFSGLRFEVSNVDSSTVAAVPGGNTTHDLVLGGRTLVSFVPHNDAFKVSYENVGLKPGSSGVVRGFLVIETTVGRVTQTATKVKLPSTRNRSITVDVPAGSDPDKVAERVERLAFRKEAGHNVFTVRRTDIAGGPVIKQP